MRQRTRGYRRSTRRRYPADRGMVTAELAAALPALILVVVAAVWMVALATAQMRVSDAAREAARAAARGEHHNTTEQLAEAVAPDGAEVTISSEGDLLEVVVSLDVEAPTPFGDALWSPTVRSSAVALEEGG